MIMNLAMLNKSATNQERREILPRHHGPATDVDTTRSTPVAVRRIFYFILAVAVFIALIASYYSSVDNHGQYVPNTNTPRTTDVNYTTTNSNNNSNSLNTSDFYTVLRRAQAPPANNQYARQVVLTELSPYQTRTMAVALFGGGSAIQKLGFGAAAGMTVGIATKRIFKVAIILVGIIFVAIQAMAIRGWLHVDWNTISREMSPHISAYHHAKVATLLSHNVPFASAFSAGCLFALLWL